MSTTFDAYPLNDVIPTYGAILSLATIRIETFLREKEIRPIVKLDFDVKNPSHQSLGIAPTASFDHQGDEYSWFYWKGIDGGTDAYYLNVDDIDRECWLEEISLNPKLQHFATRVQRSLAIGHYWSFRRSAGQPAHISLAYGFLAAAVAELTDGFLYSSDCAWDSERLPCTPADFYAHWFKPEHGLTANTREWHLRCLDAIKSNSH